VRDFGYVIGALVCGSLQDAVGYEWTFIFVALVMTVALLFMALVYKPTFDPHDFESVHMNMQASPPFGSLRDPDVSSSASRRRRRPDYVNKYSDSL
jgi:MFS family permease